MIIDEVPIELRFEQLKAKQRAVREGFPSNLGLRVHRALSWLQRAELCDDDLDAAFIFYWIAFNAAYADEFPSQPVDDERSTFDGYFRKLIDLDHEKRIYNVVWQKFPQAIRLLLDNKFIYQPFWRFQNGAPDARDWAQRFKRSQAWVKRAIGNQDTRAVLATVFDRLYVLRNQLVHGGATWNSSVNRSQVRDGTRIIGLLVPVFVDLMMDNPSMDWGAPYYPVVD